MENNQATKRKRQIRGTIVSDKMTKTVVVEVVRLKKHPKYLKYYKVTKRFKAHDENGEFHIGDRVIIEQCKPISKDKKWKVVEKISQIPGAPKKSSELKSDDLEISAELAE